MKLELLQALADHHKCTYIHFWRVPKHGAACALGPLALLISNETMQQILSMTPTEIIDEEFFMDIELVLRTFLNVFSRI